MRATNVAILFVDRDLRIQHYTPGIARLFNMTPEDRGRSIHHLNNYLHYQSLAEDAAQVLRDLVPVEREVLEKRGQESNAGRWFLVHMSPYRTLDDRIEGVIVTFVNITELQRSEEAVYSEKEVSEKIVQTVREGMLVLKPDLTVEFANDPFYEMFAVEKDETVGQRIYNLGNNQWDIPELRKLLEDILPQTKVFNDYRVEHEFEQVGRRMMVLNARRLDHVERILLAIEDVTEREQHGQELHESEARYRALAELNPDATLVHVHGRYVYANMAAVQLLHSQDAQPLLGCSPFDILHPTHHDQVRDNIRRIEQGEVLSGEYRWRRLDGSEVEVEVAAGPIVWDDQPAVQVVARDITERKQNERALRELNERLEERVEERTRQVRELAGRLAMVEHEERARIAQVLHDDLQQQLYSMKIQLGFLSDYTTDEAMLQELEKMAATVDTAAKTARGLSVELSPPILAGEGLAEAFRWLSRQMREQYQLTVHVKAQGSFIMPDLDRRVLLFQAVRELLFNVLKHAGVREATIRMHAVQEPQQGTVYRIEISDRGAGFDPEVALRSGATDGGWGLLYLRERLRLIEGHLEITSQPGEGTTVIIIAPLLMYGRQEEPAGGA